MTPLISMLPSALARLPAKTFAKMAEAIMNSLTDLDIAPFDGIPPPQPISVVPIPQSRIVLRFDASFQHNRGGLGIWAVLSSEPYHLEELFRV